MKDKRIYKALLGGILFLAGVAVGLTVCRLHGGLHPAKGASPLWTPVLRQG